MQPKFQVIIPVVNTHLADIVIANMEGNSLLPEKVIIIDNSQDMYVPYSEKFPIETYNSLTGTVNESLDLGIAKTSDCDYVTILNDDIQISEWFFRRVHETFLESEKCSAACPLISTDPYSLPLKEGERKIVRMRKREGCAITFKKKIIDSVPTIPYRRVKTFYGDDWLWLWTTHKIGKIWLKDTGNMIYHMVGQSVLKLNKRADKQKEHNEWLRIKTELMRGDYCE